VSLAKQKYLNVLPIKRLFFSFKPRIQGHEITIFADVF